MLVACRAGCTDAACTAGAPGSHAVDHNYAQRRRPQYYWLNFDHPSLSGGTRSSGRAASPSEPTERTQQRLWPLPSYSTPISCPSTESDGHERARPRGRGRCAGGPATAAARRRRRPGHAPRQCPDGRTAPDEGGAHACCHTRANAAPHGASYRERGACDACAMLQPQACPFEMSRRFKPLVAPPRPRPHLQPHLRSHMRPAQDHAAAVLWRERAKAWCTRRGKEVPPPRLHPIILRTIKEWCAGLGAGMLVGQGGCNWVGVATCGGDGPKRGACMRAGNHTPSRRVLCPRHRRGRHVHARAEVLWMMRGGALQWTALQSPPPPLRWQRRALAAA